MHVICDRDSLLERINMASKAVSNRSTLKILECLLLIADKKGFRIIGNDLELGIETSSIEAEIVKNGSIAIESKIFSDIIRRLPQGDVSIIVSESSLTVIRCGKTEFKILGSSGEEFPFLPDVERTTGCVMKSAEFRNMVRKTIFATAVEDSKPVMKGELFEVGNGTVKLVAVDGFRVALSNYGFKSENDIKVIIPGKTLGEISKILPGDPEADLCIYVTDKHVLMEFGGCTVVSRLINGDFIEYSGVFNTEYSTEVTVDREAFLLSLERASLISGDMRKNPVKLTIDGNMVITSNTEMGAAYDELELRQDGQAIEIAFNPRYLIDALKAIDDETVILSFTTPLSPVLIRGSDDENNKHVVLPLRLKS